MSGKDSRNGAREEENSKLLVVKPKSYESVSRKKEQEGLPLEENVPRGKKEEIREEKPDGGWGWLVVFGVALSNKEDLTSWGSFQALVLTARKGPNKGGTVKGSPPMAIPTQILPRVGSSFIPMTTQSLISVFGLLFIQRFEDLDITTRGASVMMGVQITALNLSGLITGPVMKKFSYRKTSVAGAVLVMCGLILTTHADSMTEFVFTFSIFTGLGLGLLYPATFVAIDSYFSKKRGRAVGLSVTGTGIGQMVLPIFVEYLLDIYGFNGTLLILAGFASHALLGATLYQPVKWHMKRYKVPKEEMERTLEPAVEKAIDMPKLKKKRKDGLWRRISKEMNMELMKSPSFLNLLIGLALVYTANMCFSMLLPFFLESIGYPLESVALCMSVLSGADILGRLIVPVFTDVFRMKSKTVFFLGAALSALTRSGLMFPREFEMTLILASACGIVRAALICNFNLTISEQTTPEQLPSALGLHMIFKGMAMMVFAPIVGFVRDYTKSYALCMHVISIFFLVLPFLAWLIEYIFTRGKR